MKHLTKVFLLGTAVLAAAACQREPMAEPNPNYNPETKEVVAQLVLNVNTGNNTQTKMSAGNVQRSGNFLGIQDVRIIPFDTGLPTSLPDHYVTLEADHKQGTQYYDLGQLFNASAINDTPTGEGAKSNRIVQLSIPVGTDAMLFYGKAINNTTGMSPESLEQNRRDRGSMVSTITQAPEDIEFSLVARLTKTKAVDDNNISVESYKQTAKLMEYIINFITNTSIAAASSPYKGYSGLGALKWKDYLLVADNTLKPLELSLKRALQSIVNIGENEYRAGYSSAVELIMTDLIAIATEAKNATPTSAPEANASRLAGFIYTHINYFFKPENESPGAQLVFKEPASIEEGVNTIGGADYFTTNFPLAKDPGDFPYGDFGIPDGAAQMGKKTVGEDAYYIEYKMPNRPLLHPEASALSAEFPPYRYTYPAELYYYVNSPLRTTSSASFDETSFYPNGYGNWYNDSKWSESWKQGYVLSDTRGVAIRDNVNYGVAMLQSSVLLDGDSFQDNRHAFSSHEDNNEFTSSQLNLQLKGILIGNVYPTVNWQFISEEADQTKYNFVLYDDSIASTSIPTTSYNYTLVLDSYCPPSTGTPNQLDIPVALEIVNNGPDFWGRDNLVRNGCTFYLLGKLRINDGETPATQHNYSNTINWPTNDVLDGSVIVKRGYQIPPIYGVDGEAVGSGVKGKSKEITRVFIQNFVTSATFKIGSTSLQNAYVTVPNLRSSQMALGLSIDLHWEDGLSFDVAL